MAFPGEERLRRWGPHWGKARGDRGLPPEGLGARDGGLQWWLHGEGADSGGLDCGGAAPTTDSGWARAGEVHRREEELAGGRSGRWKTGGVSSTGAWRRRPWSVVAAARRWLGVVVSGLGRTSERPRSDSRARLGRRDTGGGGSAGAAAAATMAGGGEARQRGVRGDSERRAKARA